MVPSYELETYVSFMFRILAAVICIQGVVAHGDHHHHHHHHEETRLLQRPANPRFGSNGQYDNFRDWAESEEFRTSGARCKTVTTEEGMLAADQAYQKWLEQNPCPSCFLDSISRDTVVIPTAWHNILLDDGTGGLEVADIMRSMEVLNAAFRPVGFEFTIGSISEARNTDWWLAFPQSFEEFEMKDQLRMGKCDMLNIYSKSGEGLLGWASFPFDCKDFMFYDGVVIEYRSAPGGPFFPYDEGDTLVHEVGHWLGLFHTFQGGCGRPNDYVEDTPPEAEPDFECNLNRDSCQDGGPPESIENFMNYGPDSCLAFFTEEQWGRMHAQHSAFRLPTPLNTPAPAASPTGGAPSVTPAPTETPGVCFSEVATVPVQNAGPKEMSKLTIGDKILTGHGYETIYGFAHNNRTMPIQFLQIHTQGQTHPLEVSKDHLVFVVGKYHPIPASSIQLGDVLADEEAGSVVTKMKTVERKGLYAPLTASGTILVDGILSSCYISLQPRSAEYAEFQGGISTFLSHHYLIHLWLAPVRMACLGIDFELCNSFDRENGLANFVKHGLLLADWIDCQHLCLQVPLLVLYLLVLGPFRVLEWVVGPELAIHAFFVGIVGAILMRTGRFQLGISIVSKKKKID